MSVWNYHGIEELEQKVAGMLRTEFLRKKAIYDQFEAKDFFSLKCDVCKNKCNLVGIIKECPSYDRVYSGIITIDELYFQTLKESDWSISSILDVLEMGKMPEYYSFGYVRVQIINGQPADCQYKNKPQKDGTIRYHSIAFGREHSDLEKI
jgi:hypothetical protein